MLSLSNQRVSGPDAPPLTTPFFYGTIHLMKIIYRDRTWELPGRITVRDAIRKVGLRPEAVLAMREGKLITDDVIVAEEDTVKLIAVVSGG